MTKTMNERFEERFPLDQLHDYHELTGHIARKGEIADFIQSEIDLAVAEERKRIRDFLENNSVWDNEYIYKSKAMMLQKFDEKINLITNK